MIPFGQFIKKPWLGDSEPETGKHSGSCRHYGKHTHLNQHLSGLWEEIGESRGNAEDILGRTYQFRTHRAGKLIRAPNHRTINADNLRDFPYNFASGNIFYQDQYIMRH